ncbi:MAG: cytochrome c biogenesis protein CcsA [Gammaproteobacteria bacterium]|nr:cytochrome c biogenesis protein CcsA [Gammaproteobacteria bacterium]
MVEITLLLYIVATVLLIIRVKRAPSGRLLSPLKWAAMMIALLAITLHGYQLWDSVVTGFGLNLSLFLVISLTAWLINLIVIGSSLSSANENLAIITLPAAIVSIILVDINPHHEIIDLSATPGLKFHILFSIISYSLLSIAAVQALLVAFQDYHLRRHRLKSIIGIFPSLETMESLLFQMISLGLILLSISLISGAWFISDIFAQHLVHKTVLSILAWLLFATLLWGRWRHGWRGRKAIRWTISGLTVLMLAYFGSKTVMELILA